MKLRLLSVQVVPTFVVDDGENLLPAPEVQPVVVSSADWPNVVEIVAKGMADLQARLNPDPS